MHQLTNNYSCILHSSAHEWWHVKQVTSKWRAKHTDIFIDIAVLRHAQGGQTGLWIGSAFFGAGWKSWLSGRIGAPNLSLTSRMGQKIYPSEAGQTEIPDYWDGFMPQTHFWGGFDWSWLSGQSGAGQKTGSARALGALPSLAPLYIYISNFA